MTRISIVDDLSRSDVKQNSIRTEDLLIIDPVVEFKFELDNICYRCTAHASTLTAGHFNLPSAIEPEQKRKRFRTDVQGLSRQPIVVEVRGHLWRAYGYLKDANQSHLTARVTYADSIPSIGELVAVRAYTQQAQILSNTAKIREIRPLEEQNKVELLLDSYGDQTRVERIQAQRTKLNSLNFLEIYWPDTDGLRLRIEVLESTATGFSGKVIGEQHEFPPKGAICRVGEGDILAQLQWQNENRLGFDLSINERKTLALWGAWVDEWQLKVLNRTPDTRQQARIASVLIRSGYLRDFKASAFASTPDLISLIPNNKKTRTWIKRFLRGGETDIDAHVSFARCSDSSWMIQELGNSAIGMRMGESILKESIETFYTQELPYLTLGSTLLALFDPSSKFNQNFWMSREPMETLIKYEARLFKLESAIKYTQAMSTGEVYSNFELKVPTIATWREYWVTLSSWLPERALLGLGMRADDFASLELQQVLSQSGYQMDRSIAIIMDGQKQVGVAVALGVPTFSNLNATSSHLWIFLKEMQHWKEAIKTLAMERNKTIFLGVTEAVIVCPDFHSTEDSAFNFDLINAKRRKIYFIPSHELNRFLDGVAAND